MINSSKIIAYTPAYNAEKTLRRTIESVLAQTHTDFMYYVLDNASIDATGDIIREFAKHDKRIIPLRNKENWRGNWILDVIKKHDNGCYVCELDADDEYEPDFLEKMYRFVTDNQLDVATCGNIMIDAITGEIIKRKVLDSSLVLSGKNFAEKFPIYRNYMVSVWCALYSVKLLKSTNFSWQKSDKDFRDIAFCMSAFRRATRAGVLAESLHRYYIAPKTISTTYNPHWFKSCKYTYKISRKYLRDYGKISKENENYLYVMLLVMIKYVLPIVQKADIGLSKKIADLRKIFSDRKTRHILQHWEAIGLYSSKADFLGEMEDWIYAQKGWENSRRDVDKILSVVAAAKEVGTQNELRYRSDLFKNCFRK